MPRALGQIDLQKNEAILDAAAIVLAERGMSAPIERIAKVAGVSKQTIYNHYGGKTALLRALVARRAARMTAALEEEAAVADPAPALARFAVELIQPTLTSEGVSMMRLVPVDLDEHEGLGQQIYEAGPGVALQRVARFIEAANAAGTLDAPDPVEAAEFFIGMIVGQRQLRQILRIQPSQPASRAGVICDEAARRFVRAYAPAQ